MVADLSEGLSPKQAKPAGDDLSWDDFIRTYFAPYVSDDAGEPIPFAEHHEHLWRWVFSIERGKRSHPYVGIWPRGGAKSTNAEMACVAVGVRQARRYAIYVCETQDQADDHVENIASMLENPVLEAHHPELTQRKMGKYGNSKGWRRNRLRTAAGLTVDAMGLDSASRGAKVDEDRPDLIILDDVDGELDSPTITQKKIKMITRKLLPAGSDDLTVLAVQNLVHTDSVFARLAGIAPSGRAKFLSDRVVSGPIPAIHDLSYTEDDGVTEITGGVPSWEGQSLERCQEIVSDIGIDAFLAECQHEVTDPEDAIFTRDLFTRFDGANPAHRHAAIERFIAIDTGFKEGQHNDPSAWCVADLSSDYRLKVTEAGAERLAFPDLLTRVDDLALRHNQDGKLTAVVFEDVGAGTSALQALGAGSWLAPYLHPFKPQGKKTERARAAAMWARRGCILLPHESEAVPWLQPFEQQLFRFPNVAHDDQVDAMVMLALFTRDILAEGLRFRQSSGVLA